MGVNSGLSILIPAYNFFPAELIGQLYQQAKQCSLLFEIICFDDGEGQQLDYQKVKETWDDRVRYSINKANLQRRGNRDALAQAAQYERILFLDQDAVVSEGFLKKWTEFLQEPQVVCGGVAYKAEGSNVHSLRYLYGIKAEQKTAMQRNQNPYAHFTCFNLMINRSLYLKMPIYNEIQGYGHEDTMMGRDLKYAFARIQHIDNPAFHVVNDSNAEYLEKTKEAVENLARLIAYGRVDEEVKLFAMYNRISTFRSLGAGFFSWAKDKMIDHLTSDKSSLFVFNLFKITYLAYLNPATIKEKGKI